MQLIEINDPTAVDINNTMSTLGEAIESKDVSSDKENVSEKVSEIENINNKCNETVDAKDDLYLNINGIIKVNGAEQDDNSVDIAGVENKKESNGQSNGKSSVDKKITENYTEQSNGISSITVDKAIIENNTTESNDNSSTDNEQIIENDTEKLDEVLEEKEQIILTNDLKTLDTQSLENNSDFKASIVSEPMQANESTKEKPKISDIAVDEDPAISGSNTDFLPASATKEKDIDISIQLKELEGDASMDEGDASSSTINKVDSGEDTHLSETTPSVNNNVHINESAKLIEAVGDVIEEAKTSDTKESENKSMIEDETEHLKATLTRSTNNPQESKHILDLEEHETIIKTVKECTHLNSETTSITNDQNQNDAMDTNATENTAISKNESVDLETTSLSAAVIIENKVDKLKPSANASVDDTSKPEKGFNISEAQEAKINKNEEIIKVSLENSSIENEQKISPEEDTDVSVEDTNSSNVKTHENNEIITKDTNIIVQAEAISEDIRALPEEKMEIDETVLSTSEETSDLSNTITGDQKQRDYDKPDSRTTIVKNCVSSNIQTTVTKIEPEKVERNEIMDVDDVEEVPSEMDTSVADVEKKTDDINKETLPEKENIATSVAAKSEDKESPEIISIDENENDAKQDKPVISALSIEGKETIPEKILPVVCKLSNTMDILSDDDDDIPPKSEALKKDVNDAEKNNEDKCINLDDDDDIMFIEDTNSQEPRQDIPKSEVSEKIESEDKITLDKDINEKPAVNPEKDEASKLSEEDEAAVVKTVDQPNPTEPSEEVKPIISKTFLKSVTKNLAEMTRNELEDFCIQKLVESVVDKSNMNEIKNKMKNLTQSLDDLRKKCMALTKQNRDLQVVVKTVQQDHKKRNATPMVPMRITRSVGMQVVLNGEKALAKIKMQPSQPPPPMTPARPNKPSQTPKLQVNSSPNIPVPRLVPASSPTVKSPVLQINKPASRNVTPQRPEKRPHTKITSPSSSVTVDLTDDEPPPKVTSKNPAPPVRLVPSQNLMPKNRAQFSPNNSNNNANSPRKVYIPISSNASAPRAVVTKHFNPRPRAPLTPSVVRMQNTVRALNQGPIQNRHPAPLPDAMKQYQPPGWKALPPAPDLKLSKVDNGIVISWKFEGYPADSYEEVASFQLYAYQETPAPPSTALWKKIGDIKALPLPMACTLTQFMSGFKYYFAVRAIDVRSRIGPFSLPGSIMLISKS